MTEAAIKTISLPLITDIQTIDTSEFDRMMDECKIIYNETSKRMPSLPKYIAKRKLGNPYNHWYKEFRVRNDIDLPAMVALEMVLKAREAYASMQSNKVYDGIPHGRGNIVRFHNQQIKFDSVGDYYFLSIPTAAGRGTRISIPILRSAYIYEYLDNIDKMKIGASELVRFDDSYWFNLTIKQDITIQEHGTPVGIDFGMRNIAVSCALENGHPRIRLWSGKQAQHKRREFLKLIGKYQQKGLLRKVRKKKRRYRDYMQTKNHQVSRNIIDFAEQFDKPYIILEDLNNFRKQQDWTFAELRIFVEYKALHAGIDIIAVDARYTSQKCNKCGHVSKKNRPGGDIIFSCQECGYTVNSDVNAAINLARSDDASNFS
jgi:IS605 OrfB family transposase